MSNYPVDPVRKLSKKDENNLNRIQQVRKRIDHIKLPEENEFVSEKAKDKVRKLWPEHIRINNAFKDLVRNLVKNTSEESAKNIDKIQDLIDNFNKQNQSLHNSEFASVSENDRARNNNKNSLAQSTWQFNRELNNQQQERDKNAIDNANKTNVDAVIDKIRAQNQQSLFYRNRLDKLHARLVTMENNQENTTAIQARIQAVRQRLTAAETEFWNTAGTDPAVNYQAELAQINDDLNRISSQVNAGTISSGRAESLKSTYQSRQADIESRLKSFGVAVVDLKAQLDRSINEIKSSLSVARAEDKAALQVQLNETLDRKFL